MSEMAEDPQLMLEIIAKLVYRLGGYVEVAGTDHPTAAFNLMSKFDKDKGALLLKLEEYQQVGRA